VGPFHEVVPMVQTSSYATTEGDNSARKRTVRFNEVIELILISNDVGIRIWLFET